VLSQPDPATAGFLFAMRAANVYNTHMNSKDLIRQIEAKGWVLSRVRGSHHIFRHPELGGHLSVPHPRKDLGLGLVRKIRQQAGLE